MEKFSWILWMVLLSGRQRWKWENQRDGRTSPAIVDLKDGGRGLGPRNGATSRSWKRHGSKFFPHNCQEECSPDNTFIFTQRDPLVNHRKVRINVYCPMKPFVPAAVGIKPTSPTLIVTTSPNIAKQVPGGKITLGSEILAIYRAPYCFPRSRGISCVQR